MHNNFRKKPGVKKKGDGARGGGKDASETYISKSRSSIGKRGKRKKSSNKSGKGIEATC